MGKQAGALLGSMLLGGNSSLDEEMREIFTANGLAHLLSVSGTHLVLLAGLLTSLLKPLPPLWRRLGLTLCLSVYALLCGLRPPVLRALLMSTVLLWGREAAFLHRCSGLYLMNGEKMDRYIITCLLYTSPSPRD